MLLRPAWPWPRWWPTGSWPGCRSIRSSSGLLAAAAILTLAHSAMTGRAAPVMFQIGRAGDDPAALAPLLGRFARWSAARAAAQAATFIVVAAAVAAGT